MIYDTTNITEKYFSERDILYPDNELYRKIPAITVDNYVELGQITAIRFLEWVCRNPGGVIALPTGKTPEFFIKWVEYYLENWNNEVNNGLLANIGFDPKWKPDMGSLTFFQLDEFFPINPEHERSFNYFVHNFYIQQFGLDPEKTHLINAYHFSDAQKELLGGHKNLDRIFPDGNIDLNLRFKQPSTEQEMWQQKAIKIFDEFCDEYEEKIREKGGIGFFLGGIGPDGHIAFNVRGSSFYSTTRLTDINYETQAAAASDLGGIESVKKKAVITMGLKTITYNPHTVAVIIAAGETKGQVVKDAVEKEPQQAYPGTSLQQLQNARFYLTKSATVKLEKSEKTISALIEQGDLSDSFYDKLVQDGALRNNLSLMELARTKRSSLPSDKDWKVAENLTGKSLGNLAESAHSRIIGKIQRGISIPMEQRFMHTAPHHDDIELAYFPLMHHLVRSKYNENHFVYCTSGFTAVTNHYLRQRLEELIEFIDEKKNKLLDKPHRLFQFQYAQDDIVGYLKGIASQNKETQAFYIACRLCRVIALLLDTEDLNKIREFTDEKLQLISTIEPGRMEPDLIQQLKGRIREFEAELVWAHFGIDMKHVDHLRLHFYSGQIFPEYPDHNLDVLPIYRVMEQIKPTVITLALDPEGSGPDTHFKTLVAISEAIDKYVKEYPEMNLKIWGYRNVWSRFDLSEANMVFPISMNSFAVLHNMFQSCFLSQKSASFPSYELEGSFSELAQMIWVQQGRNLINLLGNEYFYENPNPLMRRSYGAILIKEMNYQEFSDHIRMVRRLLKGKEELKR
ncbi:MAG: glucosamine-6-phosphate deaminase [Bacteroidota bacterium]